VHNEPYKGRNERVLGRVHLDHLQVRNGQLVYIMLDRGGAVRHLLQVHEPVEDLLTGGLMMIIGQANIFMYLLTYKRDFEVDFRGE
jgi:hypothetical protein